MTGETRGNRNLEKNRVPTFITGTLTIISYFNCLRQVLGLLSFLLAVPVCPLLLLVFLLDHVDSIIYHRYASQFPDPVYLLYFMHPISDPYRPILSVFP